MKRRRVHDNYSVSGKSFSAFFSVVCNFICLSITKLSSSRLICFSLCSVCFASGSVAGLGERNKRSETNE